MKLTSDYVPERLDDSNFVLYCFKFYENPQCETIEEFEEDVKRIKYIKKLLTRYEQTGELKDHLILNHFIVLNNVFGAYHLPRIIFLKMGKQLPSVKPFLELLNILPKIVRNIGKDGRDYYTEDIPSDERIEEALSKL